VCSLLNSDVNSDLTEAAKMCRGEDFQIGQFRIN
jgi:hypothetical protein